MSRRSRRPSYGGRELLEDGLAGEGADDLGVDILDGLLVECGYERPELHLDDDVDTDAVAEKSAL